MDIIYILIPVTLLFIGTGIALFFWSVKNGQYDDVDSPASRILFDDDLPDAVADHENKHSTDHSQHPESGGEPSPKNSD